MTTPVRAASDARTSAEPGTLKHGDAGSVRAGECGCGCGALTRVADRTRSRKGWVKGQHQRFLRGHGTKGKSCPRPTMYRLVNAAGYILVMVPDHPRAHKGYVFEHILVVEAVLGKHLPDGAVVHHINGVKSDNRRENLVLCPDLAYHNLIHGRQRALEGCGRADWVRCRFCRHYGPPETMWTHPRRRYGYHRECRSAHRASRAKGGGQ